MRNCLASAFCLALAASLSAAPSGPRVHDPSTIVREGERYYVFHTGRGLLASSAADPREFGPGVGLFPSPPPWAERVAPGFKGHYWAPDLIRCGDRWLLYYSVSIFGKRTSAIGLATSPTLDPHSPLTRWKDEGVVISTTEADDFNAIDPALFRDDDGRLWMVFGSYWTGIKLVELDPATGRRKRPDERPLALAWKEEIEAASICRHEGNYYLFVNWGRCCEGLHSTYNIRVGRSLSVTGPYRDREGADLLAGGGTLFLGTEGSRIGPGHFARLGTRGRDAFSYHYYDAKEAGRPKLGIRFLEWRDGWPVAGKIADTPPP